MIEGCLIWLFLVILVIVCWRWERKKKVLLEWVDIFKKFFCKIMRNELIVLVGYIEEFCFFIMREIVFLLVNWKVLVENEKLIDKEGRFVGGIFLSR